MATLLSIPAELLLNIIFRLTDDINLHLKSRHFRINQKTLHVSGIRDLCNLAVSCRRLLPTAQEVLYSSPFLPDPKDKKSHVLCLVHTLLDRPDLAKLVQKLHLTTLHRNIDHPPGCAKAICDCRGVGKIRKHLDAHNLDRDGKWMVAVRDGSEPALGGLLLTLLPNLEVLAVRHFREHSPSWDINLGRTRALHLDPADFFPGSPAYHTLPGLKNLQSLSIHDTVSWPLLELPTLKNLTLGLTYTPATNLDIPREASFSHNITTLTVYVDVMGLELDPFDEPIIEYMMKILAKLKGLRNLTIRLTNPRGDKYNGNGLDRGGYANLVSWFADTCSDLDTLIIDTTLIWTTMRDKVGKFLNFPYDDVKAMLTPFTKLRRLVAPEQALKDDFGKLVLLPSSIETLEMMDTYEIRAEELLEGKQNGDLSNLKKIILHDEYLDFDKVTFVKNTVWDKLRQEGVGVRKGRGGHDDDELIV